MVNRTKRMRAIIMVMVFVLIMGYGDRIVSSQEQAAQNSAQGDSKDNRSPEDMIQALQEKNNTLTQLYGALKADRDNLLTQSQRLLEENKQYADMKKSFDQINGERSLLLENKKTLEEKTKTLEENFEKIKMHLAQLTEEKNRIEKLLAEEQQDREARIKEIRHELESEYKGLVGKVTPLKKEKKALTNQLEQARGDIKASDVSAFQHQQEVDFLKSQLARLESQCQELKEGNMHLVEEARTFPKKFTEMAHQNQRLTEETADMHYNLGVFYVNNKEYKRAIPEFEKALKLKPNDANANYNLGYIYAEHLVDRQKAIQYFKKYLTYAPDAQDAEWVRKYLLTWQTWYGKGSL